jgi:hypothetical protein
VYCSNIKPFTHHPQKAELTTGLDPVLQVVLI